MMGLRVAPILQGGAPSIIDNFKDFGRRKIPSD